MKTKKIIFTGNFWEFLGINIVLFILSVPTFGIALIYSMWWNATYFVKHLEIEM